MVVGDGKRVATTRPGFVSPSHHDHSSRRWPQVQRAACTPRFQQAAMTEVTRRTTVSSIVLQRLAALPPLSSSEYKALEPSACSCSESYGTGTWNLCLHSPIGTAFVLLLRSANASATRPPPQALHTSARARARHGPICKGHWAGRRNGCAHVSRLLLENTSWRRPLSAFRHRA